ncbi:hypothetical protein J7L67_01680 [bacterium]|nr:hypothetical protein [bacterium]
MVTAGFIICGFSYAVDEIETQDGTVFRGKITKEDQKSVYLEMNTGTVAIKRAMIKSVKMQEKWGIEKHVSRQSDTEKEKKEFIEVDNTGIKNIKDIIYFPLNKGNWWKYRVSYKPESLYGEPLEDRFTQYDEKWVIDDLLRTDTLTFLQYSWHLPQVYKLSIKGRDGELNSKLIFVGSLNGDIEKSYVVMRKAKSEKKYFFNQRIVPVNPFLKFTKKWTDIGQELNSGFKSSCKIIGVEGINTLYGFFDDCLVVQRMDKIDNQALKSRSYIWFAPNVGIVKMVQEIIYPQFESGTLLKSSIFQEYELIDYGVH